MRKRALSALGRALAVAVVGVGPWTAVARHAAASNTMPGMAQVQVRPGSASAEPLKLRVEVSYKGFNGSPEFAIEAEQGQQVEITFVWADTAVLDNSHRIYIKGYELKTGLLNKDNPEQVVSFTADKPGTFEMVCDWRCEGHKKALQNGRLIVRALGGGPAGLAPTRLMTEAALEGEDSVVLTARLQAEDGRPISKAPVSFYVDTGFAGVQGAMKIGSAETDEQGVAGIVYRPTFSGLQHVTVRFDESGLYAGSEAELRLDVQGAPPAYEVASHGLEAIRTWAPLVLVLVLLAVWSTFGFVLFQVYRIRRSAG